MKEKKFRLLHIFIAAIAVANLVMLFVFQYGLSDSTHAVQAAQRASAERMKVLFSEGSFSEIIFYRKIEGTFGPEGQGESRFLPGFQWLDSYRPKERSEVFNHDSYVPPVLKEDAEEDEDE